MKELKCSDCQHGRWLEFSQAYSCKLAEQQKDVIVFKGKTKPHNCPLNGGKKYLKHGNRKDIIEVRLPLRG